MSGLRPVIILLYMYAKEIKQQQLHQYINFKIEHAIIQINLYLHFINRLKHYNHTVEELKVMNGIKINVKVNRDLPRHKIIRYYNNYKDNYVIIIL